MNQGMRSLEPAQDFHFQSCSTRQSPCTELSWRRFGLWKRFLKGARRSRLHSVSSPSSRAGGRCMALPHAFGRANAGASEVSADSSERADSSRGADNPSHKRPGHAEWQTAPRSPFRSRSNGSHDMQFNNSEMSGSDRREAARPGMQEVYETPKRGPGWTTDAPQPVRRPVRDPGASRPFTHPKDFYPRKPTPLFEQIEELVSMTPDDEERAVEEKGYWVRLLQKGGLLDTGSASAKMRKDLGASTKHERSPFRSGYLVNRLLSQITDWRTVFTVLRDLEPLFDHINISTAMHRLAKVSFRSKLPLEVVQAHPGYPHLLDMVKKKVTSGRMRARQLANTLWAFGKLGHDAEEVVDALIFHMQRTHIATWQEQEISNAVWAMATLSRKEERLLEIVARDAVRRGLGGFAPQAISNMVWGFAVLEYNNNPFMMAVAEYFVLDLSQFATQAVSNILWGCAVLNFYDQDMFNAAALEIQRRISSFNDQEISNSLLAFAKMEHVDVNLLRAYEQDITRPERLREFTSQALSNMAWSFATLRWYPEKVLAVISRELQRRMNQLSVQEISVSIWAMAKLGYHPGRSLVDFGRRIEELVPDFGCQACANSLWGLSVLQATQLPCFQMLVDRLGSSDVDKVEALMLHQLFQSLLLARLEARRQGVADPVRTIPDHTYSLILRVWKETVSHTLSSRFHIDVSKMLREVGVAHDFEFVTEDGLFSIDIALAGPRGPVAIEVDGPYHFTLNTRQPLGSTLIRRRLLHALGWTVLSVPFYDYYALGSVSAKMQYLTALLRKVDIVVELDERLQERAEAAAGAESLGSLELPQGRPSPSDGPTRQDDIAGPNFPAQPTLSSKTRHYERVMPTPRPVQAAGAAPRPAGTGPIPARSPGPATMRSQGPVARNPLSRTQARAATTSQQQAMVATVSRPPNGAAAVRESKLAPKRQEAAARHLEDAVRGRKSAESSAQHEGGSEQTSPAVNGSVRAQQNGAHGDSGEDEESRKWREERAAQLKSQLLKTQLQPLCRKYDLAITGRKVEIVQRLLDHEANLRKSVRF